MRADILESVRGADRSKFEAADGEVPFRLGLFVLA
jgi:hypothetical protein